jgi:hypothetical protein
VTKKTLLRPCQLPSLESPGLAASLPCIERLGGILSPDPDDFPCCAATGIRDDRASNTVSRCDLVWRLERLRALDVLQQILWKDVHEACGDQEPSLDGARLTKVGCETLVRCREPGGKGFILPTGYASDKNGPTWIWAFARAAVWRFGFAVHVVSIGRTPENLLQIPHDIAGQNPRRPILVLVEAFDLLAKPAHGFALDLVLSSADARALPLFIALDFGGAVQPVSTSGPTARGQFARRLRSARSNMSLETLLGPVAASRLQAVSESPRAAGLHLVAPTH